MDLGLKNPQRHDTLFPTFPYWHRAAWQGTKRTTTLEILYIIPQSDKNNIESGNEKTMACGRTVGLYRAYDQAYMFYCL